jgi:AcrR family transcriptional regulator
MKTNNLPREKPLSRRQRRVKTTRRKILNAARETFAEKGLDLSTIDDITERADVGKGTFYYHFHEKNEVISSLIKEMMEELIQRIEENCEAADDLTALLDTIIGVHIEFFSDRWEDFVLYLQGSADLTLKEGYTGLEVPFLRYLKRLGTMIDSVVKHELSEDLLRRFGCAVAGFVSGYYSFLNIGSEGQDVEKVFSEMRDAFVASLAKFINESITDRK